MQCYSTKTDPRENFRDSFGAWQLFGNYCKECFHQSKILLVLVLKARISLADIKLCEYEVLSVAMPLASAESCLNLAVRKMSLISPLSRSFLPLVQAVRPRFRSCFVSFARTGLGLFTLKEFLTI